MSKTLGFAGAVPVAVEELTDTIEHQVNFDSASASGDSAAVLFAQRVGKEVPVLKSAEIILTDTLGADDTDYVTFEVRNMSDSDAVVASGASTVAGGAFTAGVAHALTLAAVSIAKGDMLSLRIAQSSGAGKAYDTGALILKWQ